MELQSDRVGEGESVRAEGVTRYVAEATRADGGDVRLVLLEAEPEGCRAGRRAGREFSFSASASPAATSTVHQGAPVVRQREDLHLEVSARGCCLQQQTETLKLTQLVRYFVFRCHSRCIVNLIVLLS